MPRLRPSWDDYFLDLANTVAKRSTCNRGRAGCVIVRDRHILVTGYAGSPISMPRCDDVGHQIKKTLNDDGTTSDHCIRTVHAEQNAICQAALIGVSINDATVYCRMTPCRTCAMLLVNCGIKRVVCERKYHAGKETEELFKLVGIELVFKHDETQTYE